MKTGKFKGFTLIEMIVVVAIIAALACILVPMMIGFVNEARASRVNANARNVYNGAKLALIEYLDNKTILPGEIYIGDDSGTAHASVKGSDDLSVGKFMGEDFEGHFAFVISDEGPEVIYAVWSNDYTINPNEARIYSMQEILDDVTGKGIGSYPNT